MTRLKSHFRRLYRTSPNLHTYIPTSLLRATQLVLVLATLSVPVAAQSSVGGVYCGTGVETGIDLIFSAIAGLGLPATGLYTGSAGLSYMRAGGNPEKQNKAKEKLLMSAVGFGIIVLALISPALIDKIGSQMGFGFSDCVKPF